MGAGLHGKNGLPALICIKLYKTYVLPRVISGLESVVLTAKNISNLEKYHRNSLRILQSLPMRCATEAIYLMSGTLPIEALLDMRYLSLFGAVCRKKESTI